ncbi:protein rep [Bifidobacterium aquikefiri]|uniref:protein rep n=1 Tax=Bifidobacterium aquikefiri TaxID=1653207 RepID=UPI0039EAB5BC
MLDVQDNNIAVGSKLDRYQQSAVNDDAKRLAIIAPAGSGKTTVLTERVQHFVSAGVKPEQIFCVTFTNSAVLTMMGRLSQVRMNSVHVSTIHTLAIDLISDHYDDLKDRFQWFMNSKRGQPSPAIIKDTDQRSIIRGIMRDGKKVHPKYTWSIKKVTALVASFENTGVMPTDATSQWVIGRYLGVLKSQCVTTIAGIVGVAADLLNTGVIKPPHISALLVDEAQDLNPVQSRFIEALNADTITAVGDPLQAIYGFQGASPAWLQGLASTDSLDYCYRSVKSVVDASNALSGRSTRVPAGAPDGEPVSGYAADDEIDEANHIVAQIQEYLRAGVHAYDSMILTRVHSQQKQIKSALAEARIQGVQVMTVHEAKGMEAEIVIIAGMCEQIWNPENDADDVLREAYTSMTRAKKALHITWASQALINGQVKPVDRLRLLDNLPVRWSRELTTREQIERNLGAYATLTETTRENLAERKHATERIAAIWGKVGEAKKAQAIRECTSLVTYEHYLSDDDPSKDRWTLAHGTFCNQRTCPICTWRRSVRNRLKLQAIMNFAHKQNQQEHPKRFDTEHFRNPLFLTITIPSVEGKDLRNAVHDLLKAWRQMTRNPDRSPLWSRGLVGYWRSLEVTRNAKTGLYHPHLHVLFLATTAYYVDRSRTDNRSTLYRTHDAWQSAWSRAYAKVTGCKSNLIVDARAVQGKDLEKAVAEVTKYVTKDETMLSTKLDDHELCERLTTLDGAIRGVKLVDQGGVIDRIMQEQDMNALITSLLENGEDWSKTGEDDFSYVKADREYYATAHRDSAPAPVAIVDDDDAAFMREMPF